jgi:SAM-dependent methyltransferase
MRDKGWRVCGVEPVLAGVEEGRKAGFDIRHGSLLDVRLADASFDYVRSNHSFEHIVNPLEVLKEIRRILRPGGKLFIGVPNAQSLPARVFGRYWWYMGVPLHPYTYSPATLTLLLVKAGFQIEAVYYNSNYGGVTGSLQIFLNRNSGKKAGDGWVMRNPALKLLGNIVARAFDCVKQGDAIELISCRTR